MMQPQYRPEDQLLRDVCLVYADYNEAWFEAIFTALDRLHDVVSTERLGTISPMVPAEMVGWLEDIIYTAQETIVEIRKKQPGDNVTEAEAEPLARS